ncbi:hypothetical protein MN0502_15890 [Arthrobacter sp. MN05-02]|nr:hypothetical protein MN0502_15890 [Arthrobacter sp. MN05-02]
MSLVDDQGRKRSTGYTDDVVAAADALQYELGQGPCLTAWAAETTVQIDDVVSDDRWPLWRKAVADLPLRSTLSTALVHDGRSIGALKVYSPLPAAFSAQDRKQLTLLASPAATLLGSAQPDSAPAAASRALQAALARHPGPHPHGPGHPDGKAWAGCRLGSTPHAVGSIDHEGGPAGRSPLRHRRHRR